MPEAFVKVKVNSIKILFVEDEPDIQIIAKLALEAVGGHTVEVCNSGLEALELVPRFQPELILLDVMMPGMDGVQTLEALRKMPDFSTPVVFVTAKVQPHELALYRKVGALDVIPKPFDPMGLSDEINKIWRRWQTNGS